MMLTERGFAIVLAVLMIPIIAQAVTLDFLPEGGIGAGFFPLVLSIVTLVLVLGYLLSVTMRRDPAAPADRSGLRQQAILLGALVLAVLLGPYLGLLVTMVGFLLLTLIVLEGMSWLRSIAFSAGATVFMYLVFHVTFGVNLLPEFLG